MNEYTLCELLGEGSFASVYAGTRVEGETLKKYAIKVFDKSALRKRRNWTKVGGKMVMTNALQSVDREIALMKRLKHPNLCTLYEVIDDEEGDTLYLVLDYVEKGQVMDFVWEQCSYSVKGMVFFHLSFPFFDAEENYAKCILHICCPPPPLSPSVCLSSDVIILYCRCRWKCA